MVSKCWLWIWSLFSFLLFSLRWLLSHFDGRLLLALSRFLQQSPLFIVNCNQRTLNFVLISLLVERSVNASSLEITIRYIIWVTYLVVFDLQDWQVTIDWVSPLKRRPTGLCNCSRCGVCGRRRLRVVLIVPVCSSSRALWNFSIELQYASWLSYRTCSSQNCSNSSARNSCASCCSYPLNPGTRAQTAYSTHDWVAVTIRGLTSRNPWGITSDILPDHIILSSAWTSSEREPWCEEECWSINRLSINQ